MLEQMPEDVRKRYVDMITQTLPPELKEKASQIAELMETFKGELIGMMERIESEPELIPDLKVTVLRAMMTTIAVDLYFRVGPLEMCNFARNVMQAIMLETSRRKMAQAKKDGNNGKEKSHIWTPPR